MATPDAEAARLEALARYDILDTEPEQAFDDLARLAAHVCAAPIALVSLVDAARQWFKARVGLELSETPRASSFCAHAIREDGLFIVPDAAADARFADNPLVTGWPGIRFYAGATLVGPEGHPLGTLCVIDRVSRSLSPAQAEMLRALGRQVVAQIELRRALADAGRAEAEARDSQARTAAVLEAASDAIATVDKAGLIVDFNAGAERIFGHRRAGVIGRPFGELVSPEAAAGVDLGPGAGPGAAAVRRTEVLAIRRGGEAFPAEMSVAPIAAGGPAASVIQVRDLTAWKRAMEAKRLLAAIVESSEDAIVTKDLEGVVTSWNGGAERIFGYAASEAIGRHIAFLIPEGYREDVGRILDRIRRGERVEHFETRRVAKDGRELEVSLSVSPVRDADGRIVGAAKVAREVGRRRPEEASRGVVHEGGRPGRVTGRADGAVMIPG